jgi:hypothetical protein
LRRQAAGCRKILDRLLMPTLSLIDQAAAVECLNVVGIGRKRLVELCERFVGFSGSRQFLTARRVILGLADVLRGDRVGGLLGSGRLLRFIIGAP